MSQMRVLFVFTSADKLLDGRPTGWYLPEAAHPFYVLRDHVTIDFASPAGANPPLDMESVEQFKEDEDSTKFLNDTEVKSKMDTAKSLNQVSAADYDAIFYVGGHGPMLDLATDPLNIKLINEFWRSGKVVAAVCHGPGALVGASDEQGHPIFKGRKATGFSNAEEEQAGKTAPKSIPFMLEDRIVELGGNYQKASQAWGACVQQDGKLITGQNPASAKGVGEAILKALS
ncbi:related to NonF protein, involved in nonactin biosynthesis [Serendipita indica DSM 11827]|uniref:D-lactate dehydratase n=1 Tax=Serendipita indica (strain DSM 11827) TaxID=1109443 RepID=G4TMF7_SERID|nr:related to NonF protein, involved in nonactin biosynthesis [Serendipita indica DSM 11827]